MRDHIYPEHILEHIRSIPGHENYSENKLSQDLDQLVTWKNIIPSQEIQNPRTIAEFNRKIFRYQITSYTVRIERMLEQLEKSGEEFCGSLDKKPFEKLYLALCDVLEEDHQERSAKNWHYVLDIFTSVRENTADHPAYLSSEKASEWMKRESFFAYKEKFISYLRDFVQGSYQMAIKIQDLLEKQDEALLMERFVALAQVPDLTPRFEDIQTDQDIKVEELKELWSTIRQWFVQSSGHPSQYQILQERTNKTIRNITANIRRIGERNRRKLSRKKDYLHVAKWFLDAQSIDEAHCIASVKNLNIYQLIREKGSNIVVSQEYHWNGAERIEGGTYDQK